MRIMNCRSMRREIEEAGSGDLLSAAGIAHLETCAACETLSRQQTRLHAIVSGLGTVEAPGDFEFRLRARLAGERHGSARTHRNMSFALRSAALAASLLLIGSLVAFVALRPGAESPSAGTSGPKQVESPVNVTPGSTAVAAAPTSNTTAPNKANVSARFTPKGRGIRNELATVRIGNRVGTRDLSGTRASVLTSNQLAESYPTAAFPINASYQSLKVSVDDASGTSRTISLPSVSFGSQRTLSQNASPIMASARGSW